jgi:feruloyl esterase
MGQTVAFGADPQARADYGYQAVAALTPMAKALIATAYGKRPDRSYIGGCSNGGRHTMVAAARLGDAYDGYLAGAPGYRLPQSALAQLWGATLWQGIATPGATTVPPGGQGKPIPDLGSAFTPAERRTVGDAVQGRCDALDGVRDGMTLDTKACQAAFDLERDVATCSGPRDGRCLSTDQKRVLSRVQAGHRLANGQPLYASFPWDPSIASPDWSNWKFVNALTRGPLGVGRVFGTPPGAPVDLRTLDVEARRAAMDATTAQFTESVLAQMTPPGHENPTNLQALWARGARMIIYHGSGDPVFSVQDTVHWLERVDTVQGGRSADSIRLFVVPGMPHCRGGASTDQFDLLTPLVRWVEQGIAPNAVLARSRGAGNQGGVNPEVPASWSPGRTRPLCAWPAVARYNGSGPIDDAASFNCHP